MATPADPKKTTTAVAAPKPKVNYDIPVKAIGGLTVVRNELVKYGPEIQSAIPSTIPLDAKRLVRVALGTFQRTPSLLDCTLRSIIYSILQASALGLECDGTLGHAYLVPFKTTCQLIVGYRGYISLMMRSGFVSHVQPRLVLERDEWDYQEGTDGYIHHKPRRPTQRAGTAADPIIIEPEEKEIVAAYVLTYMKDGKVPKWEWMWKEDVDKIRARSRAGASGPWVTDYGQMALKTVIRRNAKTAGLSPELTRLAVAEEQVDFNIGDMPLVEYEMPAEIAGAATKARQEELREQYGANKDNPAADPPKKEIDSDGDPNLDPPAREEPGVEG